MFRADQLSPFLKIKSQYVWVIVVISIGITLHLRRPLTLNRGSRTLYNDPFFPYEEVFLSNGTLAELNSRDSFEGCRLTLVKDDKDLDFIRSHLKRIVEVSTEEMLDIIERCGSQADTDANKNLWEEISPRRIFSYPGTLWCGPGDTASKYSELGYHKKTDRCCRNHDFCPLKIHAGQEKYGKERKFKPSLFCGCEQRFKECLEDAEKSEKVAASIRYIYFDFFKPQCLKKVGWNVTRVDFSLSQAIQHNEL